MYVYGAAVGSVFICVQAGLMAYEMNLCLKGFSELNLLKLCLALVS